MKEGANPEDGENGECGDGGEGALLKAVKSIS